MPPPKTRPSRFRLADAHLSFRLTYSFAKLRLADAHLSQSCFRLADAHLSFRLTDSSPKLRLADAHLNLCYIHAPFNFPLISY